MRTNERELAPWHRRQATLLYHFASLPYLKGLLEKINQLISVTDDILEDRGGLDAAGRSLAHWQPADTAATSQPMRFPHW